MRALIDSENSILRNGVGFLICLVVIPIAMVAALLVLPFNRPAERSATEVAQYLRDFIEGGGDDYDFDDFISISIADPQLDFTREQTSTINLPVNEEGMEALKTLLAEAEKLII